MEFFKSFLLGIVQGLTELLPVSSSGHTALAAHLLKWSDPLLEMLVFVHIGTVIALIVYFIRHRHIDLKGEELKESNNVNRSVSLFSRKVFILITVSLSFTIVVAFSLRNVVVDILDSPRLIGLMLIVNGWILWIAQFLPSEYKGIAQMGIKDACIIGFAQGIAVVPGISRLGLTLSGALFCGIIAREAAIYSLLLSLPTVFLASGFEIIEMFLAGHSWEPMILLGVISASIVGYLSIKLLIYISKRGNFSIFACYSMAAGSLTLFIIP